MYFLVSMHRPTLKTSHRPSGLQLIRFLHEYQHAFRLLHVVAVELSLVADRMILVAGDYTVYDTHPHPAGTISITIPLHIIKHEDTMLINAIITGFDFAIASA